MIKNRIYLLCIAAVMILAATAVASASDDDYIDKTLAPNQWGAFETKDFYETEEEYDWETESYVTRRYVAYSKDTRFIIRVNKTSIIDINYDGRNVTGEESYPFFRIEDSKTDEEEWYSSDEKSYNTTDVIYPGTYYVRGATGSQFKYNIRPIIFKKNYSAKKAIKLKPNKKVEVVQTKYKDYARWYKIKLKKKKVIKFWTNKKDEYSDETNVSIYNSRFKEINTEGSGNNDDVYYSNKKLKKGTYYVRIGYNNVYTYFKWK